MEIFDEIHIPEEEMTDLGDGVVLLVGTARFKGRASGLDVEASAANLWTVRDGKLARFRFYQTKEDALADAASCGALAGSPRPRGRTRAAGP